MKNLIYKEWKLNIHPLSVIFATVFAVFIAIPGNPHFLSFIYVTFAYSLIFVGGTKGVDNNDLYYTATLPIRRVDIVRARTLSLVSLQLMNILVSIPFVILYFVFFKSAPGSEEALGDISAGIEPNISLYAMALIYFTLVDLIFLPWYYKNINKIIVPYMTATFSSMIVFAIFSSVLPMIFPLYYELFNEPNNLFFQFIFLALSVIIYIGGHFLIVYLSKRNFAKADI